MRFDIIAMTTFDALKIMYYEDSLNNFVIIWALRGKEECPTLHVEDRTSQPFEIYHIKICLSLLFLNCTPMELDRFAE